MFTQGQMNQYGQACFEEGREALAQPEQEPDRRVLQAAGTHPAPCARHCEAKAFEIEIRSLNSRLKQQQAEPEQEPVAWGVFEGNLHDMFFTQEEAQEMAQLKGTHAEVRPLYTAPPAAQPEPPPEWEAINNILNEYGLQAIDFVADWKATLGQAEPVAWRDAAIRLGEELSSVGPDGYYDMDAKEWLDWAMKQKPRGEHSLPQRPWQGLTEEDWEEIDSRKETVLDTFAQGAVWAQQRLRERNT